VFRPILDGRVSPRPPSLMSAGRNVGHSPTSEETRKCPMPQMREIRNISPLAKSAD
jgi:hypothetical protein